VSRPRLLWLLTTPGLTVDIVEQEARELRLIVYVRELGVTLSRKLNEMTESEWLALRSACAARVGISDPEQAERDRVAGLPAYAAWRRRLSEFQREHGIEPVAVMARR